MSKLLIYKSIRFRYLLRFFFSRSDTLPDKNKVKKWITTPFAKKNKYRGIMDGAPLTQEGICQVYQLITFLRKETSKFLDFLNKFPGF